MNTHNCSFSPTSLFDVLSNQSSRTESFVFPKLGETSPLSFIFLNLFECTYSKYGRNEPRG